MKKRLRKKLHRGEYRCWVFTVVGQKAESLRAEEICTWGDKQGFLIGGSVGLELHFDVDRCNDKRCCEGRAHPYGAVESDRELVLAYLRGLGCTVEASPLWDGYHGKDPFDAERAYVRENA